eukprot:Cvel_21098.t1-p1 / transcript=Cvel_21098.t1 / gene=Cvel_21098 / organism=Chromera_velia_CCMP2878 / gene_product=hypothetical protein / transcript_product=hypothetical protein / location=Cvel_scaffold1951:8187-8702(+) / protein_length=172 / sequence_SO=supercontig / SO=protein_coding / is_pseudo=false
MIPVRYHAGISGFAGPASGPVVELSRPFEREQRTQVDSSLSFETIVKQLMPRLCPYIDHVRFEAPGAPQVYLNRGNAQWHKTPRDEGLLSLEMEMTAILDIVETDFPLGGWRRLVLPSQDLGPQKWQGVCELLKSGVEAAVSSKHPQEQPKLLGNLLTELHNTAQQRPFVLD